MKRKIRLGVLRCDTHAYWYAPFFAKCDCDRLRINDTACYNIFCSLADPHKLDIPWVPGFTIASCWDEDAERARAFSETFLGTADVASSPDEMANKKIIDAAFIADCSGDGYDKLRLARPFIEKGIPVFVDKPFAHNFKEARALVELAKKHRTPIMSASLLEYNTVANQFARRFDEIGDVGMIVVKGVGSVGLAGIIHGIALVRNFFGDGVESVQAMGNVPLHESATKELNAGGLPDFRAKRVPLNYIHMQYANGKQGLVINGPMDLFPGRCDFHATAHSKNGTLHSPAIGDPEFMGGGEVILKLFRKTVQTGKPVVAYDSILEKIAIFDAALLSQKRGRAVRLSEITGRTSSRG
jgi:predicted dehydrogenase